MCHWYEFMDESSDCDVEKDDVMDMIGIFCLSTGYQQQFLANC
jgi:hypothetical protein